MTAVVALAWAAAVIAIDVLALRPWKTPAARAPLPWALAALAAGWVLVLGTNALTDTMARGRWTAASVTMGLVPLKAVLYSLLAYAAGRTALSARTEQDRRRWLVPAALAAVLVYFVGSDVRGLFDQARERHAESAVLSESEIADLAQRLRSGAASDSEKHAFLANPLCPPEVLGAFATSPELSLRTDVARNPKLPAAVAQTLSRDDSEIVRYYLAFSHDLPAEILPRLAADKSDMVREAMAWSKTLPDADFNRLAEDPSPRVRATAAIQARLSDEALARLRNDADAQVRAAANRVAR